MKAISVMQPWASLIVGWQNSRGEWRPGPKGVENRTWRPMSSMVGKRIAIHASKREDDSVGASVKSWPIFNGPGARVAELPRYAVVGVATLVGFVTSLDQLLARYGEADCDWYTGDIGLVLRDRVALREPITCKGSLGFWTLPDDVEARVLAQLARAA
jgi:hypothetical protein